MGDPLPHWDDRREKYRNRDWDEIFYTAGFRGLRNVFVMVVLMVAVAAVVSWLGGK
jgi:hypothetical protein